MKSLPEWLKEWKAFNEDPFERTEAPLSPVLKRRIERDLNPNSRITFLNLLGIHFFSGALSLIACPQMGLGGFSQNFSLMNLFMIFGPTVCFFLCGAFFISISLMMAFLFLENESLKLISQKKWLFLPGILTLSFISLKMLSLNITQENSEFFSHDLPWLTGALFFGFLLLNFNEKRISDEVGRSS